MTRAFVDAVSTFALIVCVGAALIAAWSALVARERQRAEVADLRRDVDALYDWAEDNSADEAAEVERDELEDTVISDPADSFARKQFLLRYRTHGGHRATDGGVPVSHYLDDDEGQVSQPPGS